MSTQSQLKMTLFAADTTRRHGEVCENLILYE